MKKADLRAILEVAQGVGLEANQEIEKVLKNLMTADTTATHIIVNENLRDTGIEIKI